MSEINSTHIALEARGKFIAYTGLKENDSIYTTIIVDGDQGEVQVSAEFPDDGADYSADKDRFANFVRCVAVAHQARSLTLISEAWQAPKGWVGRPSLSPDRKEVVVVCVETPKGTSQSAWELVRSWDGAFLRIGDHLGSHFAQREDLADRGRLDGLLPPAEVMNDPGAQRRARELLAKRCFYTGTFNPGSVH